ncbi:SgcJ/EcaC family oxidoreductase [Iamia sp. SCSIO 61187]|uniref:SgcJ/EcaC family oxidoreductase n=1 Tax=Iamia sp. SCSIO 61187 TaxID=2722752 RepID=UPI001C628773|nr:SgcJ/EcaC family oxidoreductase [Iamia sp. SCSIO 61187]QYG95117.1 SgcJ/EcaC family oxidoreductase [Iamia sp. SCSIO 61187]
MATTATTGSLDPADAAAITDLLTRLQVGFNANEPDATAAIFTDDAVSIPPPGNVVRDAADLHAYQTARLTGQAADWRIEVAVEGLTPVAPDVVIAHVRQDMTIPGGSFSNVGTAVAVRRAGAWRIARYHNSRILDSARGTAA